ncbi:uncharacterized protein B0I36DRAFT_336957 [Microdochium trichocladiopsis]|uniref:Uncharacterized protein n=1 Tax=Microdochium trichocladiopsis TaxID=1682393 RepID=A0A9P8XSY2_9PEZI|nr:uncharacterized protein B0I36DRAFT_336957 [Microdochium trichocladiopsis]KAH7016170.1 hypothetical protein B0I36DRAFT_336957 [Microdochium trichocladiopsis]
MLAGTTSWLEALFMVPWAIRHASVALRYCALCTYFAALFRYSRRCLPLFIAFCLYCLSRFVTTHSTVYGKVE